ncbi:uncharacterized protein EI90DRAFT_423526 [Cantharellus anzutake]|uniref:uncharacterized protein n=1 Tax=Cantharellus anzutake TaxID=1750568 RepID=UPI001908D3CC|nr:uncharacterized protein EI90DRAFT_423526 [Cantharellus anzutake]KAF8314636.1 hypothetical protein EI90DRAFT_423526 [Cantharellus anzutake]
MAWPVMGMSHFKSIAVGAFSGIVLQAALLGVITIQTFLYYERFSKDHISQKTVIGFLWLVQMFQVITSLYVYIWIVEHAGEPVLIKWFDTFYQLSMVICSAIVQFFFVLRLYRLSGSIWLPISLILLTLAQFGTGVVLFIQANVTHGLESVLFSKHPLTISWLTLEAVADLVIAFAMSYFLQKRRTGFRRMDTVLRKLTAYAISTGLLTGYDFVLSLLN